MPLLSADLGARLWGYNPGVRRGGRLWPTGDSAGKTRKTPRKTLKNRRFRALQGKNPVIYPAPQISEGRLLRRPNAMETTLVQVIVRDNNVDQALKALKKKMQREGIFREMKLRKSYEKPSERKAREKAEAVRRARKMERKRIEREGF